MLENLRKSTKTHKIKISLEEKMLENLVENARKSCRKCKKILSYVCEKNRKSY